MYDFYGIYASCRDAAWRCLIDFDISSLPVKIIGATKRAGIRVVCNSAVNELREGEYGASIFLPSGQWVIVYDDTLSTNEARMVVAHEFGHILLGHEYKYRDYRFTSGKGKLKSEREADMFALRVLAPACVLHELHACDSKRISELCLIPGDAARTRAKRMCVLENRHAYYKSTLEKEVRAKFNNYIKSANSQNK